MERHVAERVLAALFDAQGKMNNTLLLIMNQCTEKEFFAYRRGTGHAMGYLFTDVMNPILREHPDLEPEELKGPYEESEGVIPLQFNTSGKPMERSIAEQALAALKAPSLKVNTTLALIQKECSEEEILTYRTGAEVAMGYLSNEVIEPMLREHPDLAPAELK